MGRLDGQVALVTGGGRGIGASAVHQLAAEGVRVLVNDLDAGPADAVAAEVRAAGGEARALAGDVAAEGFAERALGAALEAWGRLDLLVCNAGYIWNSRVDRMTDAQWDAMQDVHLKAPFRLARAFARHLLAQRDAEPEPPRRALVLVSSVSGTHGAAGQVAYAAAKAGVVGLVKSLARELGPLNVNVNGVAFGFIDTRLTQEIRGETAVEVGGRRLRVGLLPEFRAQAQASVPLRRLGTPHEAAGAIVLLCLPQAAYVTGQVLEVDGGLAL
jgi:3-oxoacyl-[acyl-carrier protein] reductase